MAKPSLDVQVWALVVCAGNVYHSFLLLDAYGLEITPTGIGQTCPLVWGSELCSDSLVLVKHRPGTLVT